MGPHMFASLGLSDKNLNRTTINHVAIVDTITILFNINILIQIIANARIILATLRKAYPVASYQFVSVVMAALKPF